MKFKGLTFDESLSKKYDSGIKVNKKAKTEPAQSFSDIKLYQME